MGAPAILVQQNNERDVIPIFNLSKHILSSSEMSLLRKGLSYGTTERTNFFNLKVELFQFFRKIWLRVFFKDKEYNPETSGTGLRPPFTFYPINGMMPHEILTFEKLVMAEIDLMHQTKQFIPYNITLQERQALNALRNDNQIINPQTKGVGLSFKTVVTMRQR